MVNQFDRSTSNLDGLTIIEASAGTGKTHAIQKIVARLMMEGVPISRIALMSYTHAAVDELAERVRSELQSAYAHESSSSGVRRGRLERAIGDFDLAHISTIHGFCQRMLKEHPVEAGVNGLQGWTLETDESDAIAVASSDAWSAIVEVNPMMDAAMISMKSVVSAIRLSLDVEPHELQLQSANVSREHGLLEQALEAVRTYPSAAMLEGIVSSFNKAAKDPAERLLELLAAVPPVGSSSLEALQWRGRCVEACQALASGASARGAIPADRFQNKRKAALQIIHSNAWQAFQQLLVTVEHAYERCKTSATNTVAREAIRRIKARREAERKVNFHGLIVRLRNAVRPPNAPLCRALRQRFDVVIVDEVQDTDPMQAEIVRRVFIDSPAHRVILVGDPKQSIYSFRNADVNSYLQLRDLSTKPPMRLEWSHRSDPAVVQAVGNLFRDPDSFLHGGIPTMDVTSVHPTSRMHCGDLPSPGITFHHAANASVVKPDDMLKTSAECIAQQLNAGWKVSADGTPRSIRPRDLAVLCHQHWQNRLMADALRGLGIPVVVINRSSVYASEVAKDIARVLLAASQPRSRSLALGAMTSPLMGLRVNDALHRPSVWLEKMDRFSADLAALGIGLALRRLVDQAPDGGGRCGMLTEAGGERSAVDFDHLVEQLERAEADGVRGAPALAAWMLPKILHERGDDETYCRAMGDSDAVTLMTIHGSKGLEFGVTWLPTFFIPMSQGHDEAREELRRLLYVAMTRAKFATHVMWQPEPSAAESPLAALLHGSGCTDPQQLVEYVQSRFANGLAKQDLQDRVDHHPEWFAIESVKNAAPLPWVTTADPKWLQPRLLPPCPDRAYVLSFTSLSRGKAAHELAPMEREVAGPDESQTPDGNGFAGPFDRWARRSGLRGTSLGNLVHDALAHASAFASLAHGSDRSPLENALREESVGIRLNAASTVEDLASSLSDALASPTGPAEIPSVGQIASHPANTLRELNLAAPWAACPADLAQILRSSHQPWSDEVAEAVTRTGSRSLQGLLVGQVDLVALHDRQWFIYDYKSNDLGRSVEDYRLGSLHRAMANALYPLQAAIYAAMLARWIWVRGGRRGKFGACIGGVAYLFLRGMHSANDAVGTWTWVPEASLLQDLDDVLESRRLAAGVSG